MTEIKIPETELNSFSINQYESPSVRFNSIDKTILTLDDVAALFGVSTKTVTRLIKEEGLPCKKIGRLYLFSSYALAKWVEEK